MKAGDRVVYVGDGIHPLMIFPKRNKEIVTVSGVSSCYPDSFYIKGYEYDSAGNDQSFAYFTLRKVEEHGFTNEFTKRLANQPQIKEGIEIIEPQTV